MSLAKENKRHVAEIVNCVSSLEEATERLEWECQYDQDFNKLEISEDGYDFTLTFSDDSTVAISFSDGTLNGVYPETVKAN